MLAGGETVLIGVSGGADSVALLHVLMNLASALRLRLHVLHVDHGLRPDSAHDAEFVRALGARLGVPVDAVGVSVGTGSVEAAARAARHAALEAAAERLGAARIALGHTADDQAETLMMRVLEGTGVRGLACRARWLARSCISRPGDSAAVRRCARGGIAGCVGSSPTLSHGEPSGLAGWCSRSAATACASAPRAHRR